MSDKSNAAGGGIGFFGLLTIVFITLKLLGKITWSWLWVVSPLWLPIILVVVVLVLFVLISEAAKKHLIRVATSDALEQIIILGGGAIRISARELRLEVQEMNKKMRNKYIKRNNINENRLESHLPPEVIRMMEKIRRNSENLKGTDMEVYVRQNSSKTYDLKAVYEAVPSEDFATIVNLNKKAVESYIDINPAVKERVLETATTNYTSPFLAYRKLKK